MATILYNNRTIINNASFIIPNKYDEDTIKFINAVSTFDSIKYYDPIDYVVKGLKRIGVWDPTKAFYPFYGASTGAHKFNLFNPLDTDASYRITFADGVHNANGWLANGTSNYGNTYIDLTTWGGVATNLSMGWYNGSATLNGTGFGIATRVSTSSLVRLNPLIGVSRTYRVFTSTAGGTISAGGNILGLTVGNTRTLSDIWFNGVNVRADMTNTGTVPNTPIYLNAEYFSGAATNFLNSRCQCAFIMNSMTDSQNQEIYNIIQTYQTMLGRAV